MPQGINHTHTGPLALDAPVHDSNRGSGNEGYAASSKLHKVLQNIAHPDLFNFLGQNANSELHAVVLLQNSTEFPGFCKQMRECLEGLASLKADGAQNHGYKALIEKLNLNSPRHNNPVYGAALFQLYQLTCLHFKQMHALLRFAVDNPEEVPRHALANAMSIIQELETELDICGPGLVQKVEAALRELKSNFLSGSLLTRFKQLRTDMATQFLAAQLQDYSSTSNAEDMTHIHRVKAWLNHPCTLRPDAGWLIRWN